MLRHSLPWLALWWILALPAHASTRDEAFTRFCAGDFEEAKRITWAHLKDRPDDAVARIELLLYDKDWRREVYDRYPGETGASSRHWERLLAVHVLMMRWSPDFTRMGQLLEFEAKDKATESLRLAFQSSLEQLLGKPDAVALGTLEKAYRLDPQPDLLSGLISSGFRPELRNRVGKYFAETERVPRTSPWRAYLSGLRAYAEAADYSAYTEGVDAAYLTCSHYAYFAEERLETLRGRKRFADAEALLARMEREVPETSPHLPLYAVYLFVEQDKRDRLRPWLDQALRAKAYYSPEEARYLEGVERSLAPTEDFFRSQMIAAAIAGGILLSLLFLGWWVLRRREPGSVKDTVDDPGLLAAAEAESPAGGPLVALARYSSSEGMRDGELVEIMAQLNAQGFHVSYRTVISGEPGGAFVDYVLEVPPEEWEEAGQALARIRNQTSTPS